jgi:hypothetical protein
MPACTIAALSRCQKSVRVWSVCDWFRLNLLLATLLSFNLAINVDCTSGAETTAESAGTVESQLSDTSTPSSTDAYDPFETPPAEFDPFDLAAPIAELENSVKPQTSDPPAEFILLQEPANGTEDSEAMSDGVDVTAEPLPTPCDGVADKPMSDLGINIVLPSGLLPKDHAGECWSYLNAQGGPAAAMRCWPMLSYYWDATCLGYRPLYFEEINLERYGYGCCCQCLQPAVSAAHFFGTIPALPYCMAAHCPCECEYTLGHYRPGSCPPRRCNWPSCMPLAAATEAGVMTGFVFLIP